MEMTRERLRRTAGGAERKKKMKKTLALAILLLLLLTGCAGKPAEAPSDAAPQSPAPAAQAQPSDPAAAAEPEVTWRYEVKTENVKDKYEDAGVMLATTDNDYPVLELVCDGEEGKCGEPPEEMQAVVDAFYKGSWGYMLELDTAYELGKMALEQYNETDPEYRQYFPTYYNWTEIGETRQAGDLIEVQVFGSTYLGGAHGVEEIKNFHFDLKTGEFFELSDLTDEPEKLRQVIADDIVNGIFEHNGEGEYFDGFAQTIEGREAYNVSFGEDGMTVIFDEYEIAPYASGLPEFTIPYEKFARFLNARGERLLDLPLETRVLGDYYDALELWYWFEGSAPLDYDDTREGTITNDYGTYEMPYLRFDEPGIKTLADLRARLLTRFSEDLVEKRLDETTPAMFREFDGVLYAAAAGRGTDWTVESVDYEVELNDAKDGGQILANIHRCELNEDTMERYSTGVVDQVAIPFTLGENGTVFTYFPTIW